MQITICKLITHHSQFIIWKSLKFCAMKLNFNALNSDNTIYKYGKYYADYNLLAYKSSSQKAYNLEKSKILSHLIKF